MQTKKLFRLYLSLCLVFFATHALAEIQVFEKSSLADIEARHANQPFLLVMWSIDCAPCREEMLTLAEANRQYTDLPVVLVSTDDPNYRDEVSAVLEENNLNDLESWIFPDTSHMAIRYAIDPGWYGELPRTYLYDQSHQRVGKSGALQAADIDNLMQMVAGQ
jgi:thiol-disulfide isomerase/thioredoxin